MNTKKTFEEPTCQIMAFSVEDIITTSGWLTDLVSFDGDASGQMTAMD